MSTTEEKDFLVKILVYSFGLCGIGIGFAISCFILSLFGTNIQGAKDTIFGITLLFIAYLILFLIYFLYKEKKRERGDQS